MEESTSSIVGEVVNPEGASINISSNNLGDDHDLFHLKILVGIVVAIVSVLYFQWNRYAASRDAIAYATRMREQQELAARKEQTGQGDNNGNTNVGGPKKFEIYCLPVGTANGYRTVQSPKDNVLAKKDLKGQENSVKGTTTTNLDDNNNEWRCACEGGFLPPGMLQSMRGAEAVFRMSTGQCYHKQT